MDKQGFIMICLDILWVIGLCLLFAVTVTFGLVALDLSPAMIQAVEMVFAAYSTVMSTWVLIDRLRRR
jgi:hypothetical protein